MKTKSFLLGAAALMLATACTNDEVVQVADNSKAIGFSSFVNKATRAQDITDKSLEALNVYGVSDGPTGASVIFNATPITKGESTEVGDNSVWAYTGETQYWIPGFNYTFAAVAPLNAEGVTVNNSAATTVNGGISSIVFDNNGQVDLLFDKLNIPAGDTKWGDLVPFNLQHILSRVIFNITNNVNKDYKVEISGIKFTNAYAKGTFTPADEKWVVSGTAADFNFTNETLSAEYQGTAKTQSSYIIPVDQEENQGFNVEFTVDLYIKDAQKDAYNDTANETYHLTATLPALNYQLGYSYAFNTELTWENLIDKEGKKEIEFTVNSVAGWKDAEFNDNENNLNSQKIVNENN